MASPKPGDFCVYVTVPIDTYALVKTLNEVVNHHRSSPGVFNRAFFVVADRLDWATSHILAVDLDYEGYIDAARTEASNAGDALPSCSIANTYWWELLGEMSGRTYPKGAFAVYYSPEIKGRQEELLAALNAGLESRKDHASISVCRLARMELPTSSGTDDEADLFSIIKEHNQTVSSDSFDSSYFIVADELEWDDYGVVIVKISEGGTKVDSCRKPIDVAAEVLTWVNQGLFTWDEGKAWDE